MPVKYPNLAPVIKPSTIIKPVPMSAGAGRPSDLLHKDMAKDLSSELKKDVSKDSLNREQAGINLIQKAHDLYRNPQKVISLVPKPAKVPAHDLDLATIDEAEQKEEQNTFANGMPLGGLLIGRVKEIDTNAAVMRARDGVRSAGVHKMLIKSAEPNLGKVEKLKLYREPTDDISNNIEKLRDYKQRAMMLAYGIHETNTPQKEHDRRPTLGSRQSSNRNNLPPIHSAKASLQSGDYSNRLGLIRYNGRNEADFSSAASINMDASKDKENIVRDSLMINPLIGKYSSRPTSIQHSLPTYEPPMSRALSRRGEQSSIDHIKRIRRNLPSAQNMHPLVEEVANLPARHLEAAGVNLDQYRRIKQQEQEARA